MIKQLLILLLLGMVLSCSQVKVQQAEQDTVFVWLASCGLMKTCYGYRATLENALEDGEITYDEYYKLKRIYNEGYARFYGS